MKTYRGSIIILSFLITLKSYASAKAENVDTLPNKIVKARFINRVQSVCCCDISLPEKDRFEVFLSKKIIEISFYPAGCQDKDLIPGKYYYIVTDMETGKVTIKSVYELSEVKKHIPTNQ